MPVRPCEVDWGFIRKLEGWEAKAYVPPDLDKNDKTPSGITIAMGFDLGQQTITSISSLGLSKALENKLHPYIGVTGQAARDRLKLQPLNLTNEELEELDSKVRKRYYANIEREYNDNSDYTFSFLDSHIQTAIVSVAYQYGSLKRRCPTFFKYITKGMWNCAIAELENFGDAYKTRRLQEAKMMKGNK